MYFQSTFCDAGRSSSTETLKALDDDLQHLPHSSSPLRPLYAPVVRVSVIPHGRVHRTREHLLIGPATYTQPVHDGAEQNNAPDVLVCNAVRRGLLPHRQLAKEHTMRADEINTVCMAARAEEGAFEMRVVTERAEEIG